jgi:hypothetical protein
MEENRQTTKPTGSLFVTVTKATERSDHRYREQSLVSEQARYARRPSQLFSLGVDFEQFLWHDLKLR